MEEMRNTYKFVVAKPERQRRKWEDNIKTDLKDIKRDYLDWICLTQARDNWRDFVKHSKKPSGSINWRIIS
jgi:hypothetical protein